MAAPSSPNSATCGKASWWAKWRGSLKIARSTPVVVSASIARWNLLFRLAAVKCTLPSALSAEGETVAALAVHMQEAELSADSRRGDCFIACAKTVSSLPLKPNLRSIGRCGRSCGGNTPC
ncbi:hypothetical protein D3C71_1837570 [compost metagenome]